MSEAAGEYSTCRSDVHTDARGEVAALRAAADIALVDTCCCGGGGHCDGGGRRIPGMGDCSDEQGKKKASDRHRGEKRCVADAESTECGVQCFTGCWKYSLSFSLLIVKQRRR